MLNLSPIFILLFSVQPEGGRTTPHPYLRPQKDMIYKDDRTIRTTENIFQVSCQVRCWDLRPYRRNHHTTLIVRITERKMAMKDNF